MKSLISLIIILSLLLGSQAFCNEARSRSIFTDIKAHEVGDLITVIIAENSRASNKAKTTTEKKTEAGTEGTAGLGPLDFIPIWGASGQNESKYDGKGQTEKSGSLQAKMTVKVVAVMSNGDLAIEGNRVVIVNDDEETLFLSGTVRSRDISESNTIYSHQIADAQISSKSKGTVNTGNRPGFVTRLINWIF
ncbi:MAG: flagellar basal body L-ring protein FlgH [candidate division Zixibacteria bacterium]|nr:flagellar basal body L-ring protein FlgH [candidate division Zixibacteria bacterium]